MDNINVFTSLTGIFNTLQLLTLCSGWAKIWENFEVTIDLITTLFNLFYEKANNLNELKQCNIVKGATEIHVKLNEFRGKVLSYYTIQCLLYHTLNIKITWFLQNVLYIV